MAKKVIRLTEQDLVSILKNILNIIEPNSSDNEIDGEDSSEKSLGKTSTKGQELLIPLKNGEGSFQCDDETLKSLEANNQIIARYVGENPNGSRNLIAGITNERGNVVGLMPHPEHAIDSLTGPSTDGLPFFTSVLTALVGK